jgi:cyclohexadieny/prephenate dehydrogenase
MSPATDCDPSEFNTIAIVGVGLIGGSLAAAIKQRQRGATIIGVGRAPARLAKARQAGLIDEAATDLGAAAAKSDLLIFCTPVDRIVAGIREAANRCRPGTLITDAGSVKGTICRDLGAGLPTGIEFVGSHPLAGSEKQGFEHADPQLFVGRVCVLTPIGTTTRPALERMERFWKSLGSTVLEMSPEAHDRALAQTSHLPHVVAAALAAILEPENGRLAATGFRDTTRIAGGDPELWAAILLANAEPVLAELKNYEESLMAFRNSLAAGDAARLNELLAVGKARRDSLSAGIS